ncbi:MAG: SLC13 family permease [Candidatus Thorarchaeota archaeon]
MDAVAGLVLIVFIITYIAISSEKVNRTATSLLGMGIVGIILVAAGQGSFNLIVEHIEWHTVLFVTSMMMIVTIATATGMFQYLAIELTKPSAGDTKKLFVSFLGFVFGVSLFFDTVSTMLIMGPITIEVCKAMNIDFRPFLISEAIVANFASIPTIVGAVPNLVIAEEVAQTASLDQGLLFIVMMPLALILFAISVPILLYHFKDQLVPGEEDMINELLLIDPSYMIRSRRDFIASVLAMLILVIGFTAGHSIGFNPSLIAILVASVLLLFSREKVDDILERVNWGTIFFLVGLFGLVAALDITGIIDEMGVAIGELVAGNVATGILFMTWIPGLLSAVIDNIPVSAVLAPIAADFASISPLLPFALMFSVNIGGFVLPIGSPANILAIAMSEKEHQPIRFKDFMKIATPLGFLMLAIGTGWFLLLSMII